MKRVLVTGSTGFIGQHTIPILEQAGYKPISFSRKEGYDLLKDGNISKIVKDTNATHLLHIAWDISTGFKEDYPQNALWATQSIKLVKAFANAGGERVVIIGTQRTPLMNDTAYGYWKNELNIRVSEFCRYEDVSYAYGRVSDIFGEGDRHGRLVTYIINTLLDGDTPQTGNKSIDIMYVKDVANALCHILNSKAGGDFGIGYGKTTSITDLENMMRAILELPTITCEIPEGGIAIDITRLIRETGWKRKYSLHEGLKNTVNYIMRQRGMK